MREKKGEQLRLLTLSSISLNSRFFSRDDRQFPIRSRLYFSFAALPPCLFLLISMVSTDSVFHHRKPMARTVKKVTLPTETMERLSRSTSSPSLIQQSDEDNNAVEVESTIPIEVEDLLLGRDSEMDPVIVSIRCVSSRA